MASKQFDDIPLPGDEQIAPDLLHSDGTLNDGYVPQDPSWAGTGYEGHRETRLHCHPHSSWRCLECPESGIGDCGPSSSRELSEKHARTARHVVQLSVVTTWIPTERK